MKILILRLGIFFSNWEKSHLIPIGKVAEFRPLRTQKKKSLRVVSYLNHTVSGPANEICSSSISGIKRMAVEKFHDQISTKECCRCGG